MYTNQYLSHREHFLRGILVEPAAYEYSVKKTSKVTYEHITEKRKNITSALGRFMDF